MNFSEAMFYENYLTSDFHTNTVILRRPVCLLVKMAEMASKTGRRPIQYSCHKIFLNLESTDPAFISIWKKIQDFYKFSH